MFREWRRRWFGAADARQCWSPLRRCLPRRSPLRLELLEDRTLPATLDVTGGVLTYTAAAGATNNLTVSLATGAYTFFDPGDNINLTANAIGAGWTGGGSVATGPNVSVNSITINLLDQADTLTLGGFDAAIDPIAANGGGNAGDVCTVVGGFGGGTGITAAGAVSLTAFDTIGLNNQITTTAGSGGAVTLTANATATSTVAISNGFAIDADAAVALSANGAINFGLVSASTTIKANNAAVSFTGPVNLGSFGPITVDAGTGAVDFTNTINAANSLVVTGGITTFQGAVGGVSALSNLTVTSSVRTVIAGGSVRTSTFQTYNGPVVLSANATLTVTSVGNVAFSSTVDGPGGLVINSTGATSFGGAVGSTVPLADLTLDALGSTAINGGIVTTTNAQTYNDPVTLGANTVLTAAAFTGNNSITATNFDLTVTADTQAINAAIGVGTGIVTLQQRTAGRPIDFAAAPVAGSLTLANVDLNRITANLLRIGSANAGNLTFSQTISSAGNWNTLSLQTGAAILDNNAGVDTNVNNLAIRAGTGVASGTGLDVTLTGALAFQNSTSGSVEIVATGALTLNAVDGLTVSANAGGAVNLSAASPVTFAVNTTSAGDLSAAAVESLPPTANVDNVVVDPGITVRSTAGAILFQAGDRINTGAGATVQAATTLTFQSAVADNDGDGSQDLGGLISAPTITLNAGAAGQVSQTGGSLVANQLLLLGTGTGASFSLTDPTNQVATLAADTNALIDFHDSTSLLVGAILGTNGITTASNGLDLSIGGSWTVDAPIRVGIATIDALIGTTTASGTTVLATFTNNAVLTAGAINVTARAGGDDQIQAPDLVNTWTLNGAGSGTLTNGNFSVPLAFQEIETLNGGTQADTFRIFSPAATLAGAIAGGTGTDLLDYTPFDGAMAVTLTGPGSSDGFRGAATGIGGGFDNIDGAFGSRPFNNTLTGANSINVWTYAANDSGTIAAGGRTFIFTNFNNLVGGTTTDTFNIVPSTTVALFVDGNLPVPPTTIGDVLNVDSTGVTNPVMTPTGPGAGVWTFGNRQNIQFISIEGPTPPPAPIFFLALSSEGGGPPEVQLYNPVTFALQFRFLAYDPNFLGGVRTAIGDVNGDRVPDIITGAGTGGGPHVKVFDGTNLTVIRSFFAYDAGFTGGVNVASADVNGDGFADIITGAGAGGGPHVKVFDGRTLVELHSFFAYDAAFSGGVNVAGGDVNGDGFADIITGAGPGGGPHVKVFNGVTEGLLSSFFAYDAGFKGGVFVSAGDTNGDNRDEVITGAGAGGGPNVRIFDGVSAAELATFFAYDPSFTGGVRVDFAQGRLATGPGPGIAPLVKLFDPRTLVELGEFLPVA